MTFMPVIAFADDHQVTTVQKDTYVYCGGTYDLEVAPPKDSKGVFCKCKFPKVASKNGEICISVLEKVAGCAA